MLTLNLDPMVEVPLINIGCLFDIPTSSFVKGERGETIINGGVDASTGLVGPGNSFKSTILHYMALTAADRMEASEPTYVITYDTELHVKTDRLQSLLKKYTYLPDDFKREDGTPIWDVTSKAQYYGDEFVQLLRKYVDERVKSKPTVYNGMRIGGKPFKGLVPAFVEIDSVTEFEPKTTHDMLNSSKQEDSSTNMLFARKGLFVTKFLSELPLLSNKGGIRFFLSAHVGKKMDMDANKYQKPTKDLQYLKDGEAIKGVSPKFHSLLSTLWLVDGVTMLKNQATKQPEYPNKDEASSLDTDLNIVRLKPLRNKAGASGFRLPIVVSQNDAVLPDITNFDFIRSNGYFGLQGSKIHYTSVFLPSVKLQRSNIREKLPKSYKLRQAIQYTADLLQLKIFKPKLVAMGLWCEPETLYQDLINLGYDWNELLECRSWWTIDNYAEHLPHYLSIMDLLLMRNKEYVPYWMDKAPYEELDEKKKKDTK